MPPGSRCSRVNRVFRPIKHSEVGVRVLEMWATRHGEFALSLIGKEGERGYPISAREDAIKAAHWFYTAHPGHRVIKPERDENCPFCMGACYKCGAGCWNASRTSCEHDVHERHEMADHYTKCYGEQEYV